MGVLNVIMLHKFYLNIIEVVEVFISILIVYVGDSQSETLRRGFQAALLTKNSF